MRNFQRRLPIIPEGTALIDYHQQMVVNQQSQAYSVAGLTAPLAASQTSNASLEQKYNEARFERDCWRRDFEDLLVAFWKLSEQKAEFVRQVSRLTEQLHVSRSERVKCDACRRDGQEAGNTTTTPSEDSVAGGKKQQHG